jgi:hypothetical protein
MGPVPEKNACDGAGFNYVITADGGIWPLFLATGARVLIPPGQLTGGVFNLLPCTKTNLDLELSPRSSLAYTWGSALCFSPIFTAT